MVSAGALNRKVQFKRRAAVPTATALRGGFANHGEPVWAAFNDGRGQGGRPWTLNLAGVQLPARTGVLSIRDSEWARGLGTSDQVVVSGVAFEIASTGLSVRPMGVIEFDVTEAPSAALYARLFDQRGEWVTVRRVPGNNEPNVQVGARAIVTGYTPDELASGIDQGDRKIILSVADLEAGGFPLPLKQGAADRIVVRGRTMMVATIDDSTMRVAGTLFAYVIRATG